MGLETQTYFKKAMAIIVENIFIFAVPAIIGLFFYFPRAPEKATDFAFVFPVIVLFIVYPLIYGQYTEIALHNQQAPYLKLFERHWLNYYIVSFIVSIPLILLSLFQAPAGGDATFPKTLLAILIDSLTIYVIPLVFILQKRWTSIQLGVKCLLGNLNFSLPLVLLCVAPSLVGESLGLPLKASGFAYNYLFFVFSLFCDTMVFVAAILILKEKIFIPQP